MDKDYLVLKRASISRPPDWISDSHKYNRDCPRLSLECRSHRGAVCDDHVGLQCHQFFRESPYPIDVTPPPTNLRQQVAALDPSQFGKPLREPRELGLPLGITFGQA